MQDGDPSLHAETAAFKAAGRQRSYRGTTMVTTLSPCWYCSGLVRQFGISRVVVGEAETFHGGHDWLAEHGVEVVVLDDREVSTSCGGSSKFTPPCGTRTSVMSEASPSVSPSVSLPTIDLARDAAPQLPAVDRSLRDAGFLLVTGHGVDPDRPSPDVIRPVLRGDAAVADYLGGSGYYGSAPARVTQAVRLSRARAWALTSGPLAALGKVDMDEELARLLKGAGRPAGWRRPPSTGPSPAVSNAEWALIEPLLPAPACEPAAGGRPEAFAHLSADPPGKVVRGPLPATIGRPAPTQDFMPPSTFVATQPALHKATATWALRAPLRQIT